MYTQQETVTPAIARQYLEHNTHNRPINRAHVRELADELRAGRWRETHQGLAFATDGRLLDGQHRLMAIVEADTAAELLVTRDLDATTFGVIDQGAKRTAAQLYAIQSGALKEGNRMTAMARIILQTVMGERRVSSQLASTFAFQHQAVFERYLPVARAYAPVVAAAFAYADLLGWSEVQSAASRLMEKLYSEGDPMRALDLRARTFNRDQGQQAGKRKFDITLNCLLAVHEGRELNVARTAQPDYRALERRSSVAPETLYPNVQPSESNSTSA